MATINGKTIKMVRGDTAVIELSLTINNSYYNMQPGDIAVFSVKEDYDSEILLQKRLDGNKIELEHADTQNLDIGSYVWDVEFTQSKTGQVATIGPGKLILTADVTTSIL